jgi:hypothetical protein
VRSPALLFDTIVLYVRQDLPRTMLTPPMFSWQRGSSATGVGARIITGMKPDAGGGATIA